MTESQVVELQLGERPLPVQVRRVSSVRSRHTGRALVEVQGVVSTPEGAARERLARLLGEVETRPVRVGGKTVRGVQKWCVSWNSYDPAGGEHLYTLILRESEELALEALVLDGVELHPYEYREAFTGDELTIWAKLVGTRAGVLRLRALLKSRDTFPVVRRGIHDEPREMRFGVAEWSEHEGQIRYRVVLVDAGADPAEHPELLRIEEANTRAALAFYMGFVERLAELLEKRGLLSAEEIEGAREAAREEPWPERREFWRVRDVDLL
jgi:hypothetical protein